VRPYEVVVPRAKPYLRFVHIHGLGKAEPRWSSEEDSKKLKELKRRVHDLYAKCKATAK
jgi:hypothetical protein